jgi:SAM-dependent methyltransferase
VSDFKEVNDLMRKSMQRINITKKERDFLKNHQNIWWLRPENALLDAIASTTISQSNIETPSLDLGCGNGLFSFITAGGQFSEDYDWFMNVDTEGFWDNTDIFDTDRDITISDQIIKKPRYQFTCGLDHKINLLNQAKKLDFYERLVLHDANDTLPFPDESFKTVFCNILYWLKDPESALNEISRILKYGGRVLLCVPNTNFYDYCESYLWKEKQSDLLKILNRGRADSILWLTNRKDFSTLAKRNGLSIVRHQYYWSTYTLKIWDFGLRPFSPYLIYMANKLSVAERGEVKVKWMDGVNNLLLQLYLSDKAWKGEGGFHFFELEKTRNNQR